MARKNYVLKTSTAVAAMFAGALGVSVFLAIPSSAHRLGWLSQGGQPHYVEAVGFSSVAQADRSLADVVDSVRPSVVSVSVQFTQTVHMGSPFGHAHEFDPSSSDIGSRGRLERVVNAKGTGFFISPDGYVVTNHHVVKSSRTAEVSTVDGMNYKAQVVAGDPSSDIALLKVDGHSDFPFIKFADKVPRIGDQVFVVGNPFGLGGTVTAGIVSGLGRNIGSNSYDDLIQIDAPINKGNSGGPSFDLAGDVIGVNTMIFSPSGGSIGISFAIPADTVRNVVSQLKETHAMSRGWLGAELQPVTSGIAEATGLKQPLGAIVAETKPGGPAADSGILVGDVITSLNGDAIKDSFELSHRLAAIAPGELVDLGVMRDGRKQTLAVTLGKAPAAHPVATLPRRPNRQSHRAVPLISAGRWRRPPARHIDAAQIRGDDTFVAVPFDPA
jgi:serine protease Do